MADSIEQSLLDAYSTVFRAYAEDLQLDKTVLATVVKCNNSLTGEYTVSYNGGNFAAYAQDGATYSEKAAVYVLIPQGDMTQKKMIVGRGQQKGNDANITFVSSVLSNYQPIGRNPLSYDTTKYPSGFGVNSYRKQDFINLYVNGGDNNLISINAEELESNIKNAEAIEIEAKFFTNLPKSQRNNKDGRYGIEFVIAYEDKNNTIVSDYDSYLPAINTTFNTTVKRNPKDLLINILRDESLSDIKKRTYINEMIQILQSQNNYEINNVIYKYEVLTRFIDLLNNVDLENYEELITKLQEEGEPVLKYISYVLDNSHMTGNPLRFSDSPSSQYMVFEVDAENFTRIQSINLFCQDFVTENNPAYNSPTIFCSDVEFNCLRSITAVNDKYRLKLSTPYGIVFNSSSSAAMLQIVAQVTESETTNLTSDSTYYWFIKDDRVDSSSKDYHMYGGIGWRKLSDKGYTNTLQIYGNENKAYENNYMCVAVYRDEIILKEECVIYNNAEKRDIEIFISNIAGNSTKFSFDRGVPRFVCTINGKQNNFDEDIQNIELQRPDAFYSFYWSKVDSAGNASTLETESLESLQEKKEEMINSGTAAYTDLASINNRIATLSRLLERGYNIQGNVLSYPMASVDSFATFSCTVYRKDMADSREYCIGNAEITVQNEDAAIPATYSIVIENGDQVFQYSESGVSPDSDRVKDPIEVKALTARFYDPQGLEVNKRTYNLKWRVPLENTMIDIPNMALLQENPVTELKEFVMTEMYPTAIKPDFDYNALNNQVQAIVTYDGVDYTQYTNFLFTKVGENGTNGTDMVAKIEPISRSNILNDSMFALEICSDPISGVQTLQWNTGDLTTDNPILQLDLYQRNNKIAGLDKVTWKISENKAQSKYLSVEDAGNGAAKLDWDTTVVNPPALEKKFRSQIIQAKTTYNKQNYYAYYGLPVIEYHSAVKPYNVSIDRNSLKSITYNEDGFNPLYNKNQGIKIKITKTEDPKYIVWKAEGGEPQATDTVPKMYDGHPESPNFKLMRLQDEKDLDNEIGRVLQQQGEDLFDHVYILPDLEYSGEYTNNLVRCQIYDFSNLNVPEVEVYIPIYMSLNTYGLASINQWDGNHIEINEDENYILTPQIGAGIKDKSNHFTGLVMGKSQTYDQSEEKVGLQGFSEGRQSIFMDAYTGNTILGLPDTDTADMEGRIKLLPGQTSEIGKWKIGSNFLFNMTETDISADYYKVEQYHGYQARQIDISKVSGYTDKFPFVYPVSIPHKEAGVVLASDPSYLSIKTKRLYQNDGITFDAANSTLKEGDSLEVELNPNLKSVFTIYRHTNWYEDTNGNWYQDDSKWKRQERIGIDRYGRFYSNAVKDKSTIMSIGPIGAFGTNIDQAAYQGVQFELGDDDVGGISHNLVKMFAQANATASDALYISGATGSPETQRPIKVFGKTIELYSGVTVDNSNRKTNSRLTIGDDKFYAGYNNNYISFPSKADKDDHAKINIYNGTLDISVGNGNIREDSLNIMSGPMNLITKGKDFTLTSGAKIDVTSTDNQDYKLPEGKSFTVKNINGNDSFVLQKNDIKVQTGNSKSYLQLYSTTGPSILKGYAGIRIWANNSSAGDPAPPANTGAGVHVAASNGGYVYIESIPPSSYTTAKKSYLRLKGGASGVDYNSTFELNSSLGQIISQANVYTAGEKNSLGTETQINTGVAGLKVVVPNLVNLNGGLAITRSDNPIGYSSSDAYSFVCEGRARINGRTDIHDGDLIVQDHDVTARTFYFSPVKTSDEYKSKNEGRFTMKISGGELWGILDGMTKSIVTGYDDLYDIIEKAVKELNEKIDKHIQDTNNPHKVTAAQAGASPSDHNHDGTYAGSKHWHYVDDGSVVTHLDWDTFQVQNGLAMSDVSHITGITYNTGTSVSTGWPQ